MRQQVEHDVVHEEGADDRADATDHEEGWPDRRRQRVHHHLHRTGQEPAQAAEDGSDHVQLLGEPVDLVRRCQHEAAGGVVPDHSVADDILTRAQIDQEMAGHDIAGLDRPEAQAHGIGTCDFRPAEPDQERLVRPRETGQR